MTDIYANDAAIKKAIGILEEDGNYRVLRRFRPRSRYADSLSEADQASARYALYLDVETTGLDPETGEIIQIAGVLFLYAGPKGGERVIEVYAGFKFLEQPSAPIPPEVTAIHGITDADVEGQRIPDDVIAAACNDAAIVIAHNAEFDRPKIEHRFPMAGFDKTFWGCSQREIDWVGRYGAVAAKLGAALACFGEFTDDAHDAQFDCLVGVHCLAQARPCETCNGTGSIIVPDGEPGRDTLPCGDCVGGDRRPLVDLLASARRSTFRLWAINSPFAVKDRLKKGRRYRWNDGEDGRPKGWYKDLHAEDVEAERKWIQENCGAQTEIRFTKFNAQDRYSNRV